MTDASRVRAGNGEAAGIHNRFGDLHLFSIDANCVSSPVACTARVQLNAGKDPGRRADWREIP